jgi:pimeloyl-ACP methyl ester carboxylesterase
MKQTRTPRSFFSVAILAASTFALAIFILPQSAFAASTLSWTPFTEDPDTGERTYGTEIMIEDGGTYEVPLDQLGEAFIQVDVPVFDVEGILFYIPDPSNPTPMREFVTSFGGFFFPSEISFPQAGVYELDIYEGELPVVSLNPIQRVFAWFFGTPAYAQSPEFFIETIRFTITEAGAEPSEPDPIIVIPGILGSWEKNGELVIDPVLHTYDDLINTFVLNGFVEGETIFPFPYEWRDTNIFTAGLLRDKINEVRAICECDKVDIVAHSMGGLVARYYIQSGLYEDDVDQLVFIATPHLGSPKAYLAWEGGDFGFQTRDNVLEFVLKMEAWRNGFSGLFDYIRNRPVTSVQQLLSISNYLKDGSSGDYRIYPDNYPANTFLENLNANIANLLNSGINITNIVGNTGVASTINTLRVVPSSDLPKWEHGHPENYSDGSTDRGLEYGSGDDTVTLPSASFVDSNVTEFNVDHNAIVKTSQALVYETLVGEAPEQVSDLQQSSDFFLLLQVLSPVDVQIVAPDGKRLGKDFDTGGELNEIPGAFYSGFDTDNEYAVIPDPLDGEYKILSQGTGGGGEYTIVTGHASPSGLVQQEAMSYILPGDTEEVTITVDNQSPEELEMEDTTVVTYDTLLDHIEEAATLGWITNKKFKKLLTKTAKKAEKLSHRRRGFGEKALLHVLLVELRVGHRRGKINDDGYNLLKEDVKALLKG